MKKLIISTVLTLLVAILFLSAFSDYFPMEPENVNLLADALYATAVCDPGIIAAQKTLDARMELLADSIVTNEVVPFTERELRNDLTQEIAQMVKPQLYYNKESVADIPLLSVKKSKFILSQDGEVQFKYKPSDNFHSQVCFLNDGSMTWNNHFYCRVNYTEHYLEKNEDYHLSSPAGIGNWGCCEFDVSYSDYSLGQHSRNITLYNEYGHEIDSAGVYWQVLSEADLDAEKEMRITPIPDFLIARKTSYVTKVGETVNKAKTDFVPLDDLYVEICYLNSGYLTWTKDYYCAVASKANSKITPNIVSLEQDIKPGEWGCFSFRNPPGTDVRLGTYCPQFQLYTGSGFAIPNGDNYVCWNVY